MTACFADRKICNLADPASLEVCLEREQPSIIINCAAYTAVDAAEQDEATAVRVNADAVGEMATWAAAHDAMMVHFLACIQRSASGAYSEDAQSIRNLLWAQQGSRRSKISPLGQGYVRAPGFTLTMGQTFF